MQHIRRAVITLTLITTCAFLLTACSEDDQSDTEGDADRSEQTGTTFDIVSATFDNGDTIPVRFTCNGDDVSPPLTLENVPDAAESTALMMDDPDAPGGTWVHWVVFNLPDDTRIMIPEAVTSTGDLPGSPVQGENSWGRNDYGGPCPPDGEHRYFFKAYALDTELDLGTDATKADVEAAMDGHILAEAQLTGIYEQ